VSIARPLAKAEGGSGSFSADVQRSTARVVKRVMLLYDDLNGEGLSTSNTAATRGHNDIVAVERADVHHGDRGRI
jgi:hypothetical protein